MVPLSYESIDFAAGFFSSECSEGIVGISGNTLRIITPERFGEVFNQTVIPLSYSPRKMVMFPENR
jgi:splicing factor 3B subunit 3